MKVEFHPDAQRELAEAVAFYNREVSGLGVRFADEVERATTLIEENPEIGQALNKQLNRVVLRRFPFSLIYAPQPQRIFFLAVAHQRRRPGYWRARVES